MMPPTPASQPALAPPAFPPPTPLDPVAAPVAMRRVRVRLRLCQWLTGTALLAGGAAMIVPPRMQGTKVGNRGETSFWVEVAIALIGGFAAIGIALFVLLSLRTTRAPVTKVAAGFATALGFMGLLVASVLLFSG